MIIWLEFFFSYELYSLGYCETQKRTLTITERVRINSFYLLNLTKISRKAKVTLTVYQSGTFV